MMLTNHSFPLNLLSEKRRKTHIPPAYIDRTKQLIVDAFCKKSIAFSNVSYIVGPTVVRFELIPERACKLKQIRSCEDKLNEALSEYGPIRLIAPVPSKGTIAVEVPRPDRQIVQLREVLESKEFQESGAHLPIALGIDYENNIAVADLAKMPHLLIAGATGQGKSVLLNNIILSLLYRLSPADLKLVLIDPKQVEFGHYNRIKKQYLLRTSEDTPQVITEVEKVPDILFAIYYEVENRYDLLIQTQCRTIREYNHKIADGKLSMDKHHHQPNIVVVIDEFANLMNECGENFKMPLALIAVKSRAVGIHVVIATHQTSTDIITGIIKAYFPSRIGFRVESDADSKTILDKSGAQQLLGMGDMLFNNSGDFKRIQSCFIDTPEIESICEWIQENVPDDDSYILPVTHSPLAKEDMDNERDPLFCDVARYIIESGMASTSNMQRRFSIGYSRACRLMNQLEKANLVGPSNGGKPREVLPQNIIKKKPLFSFSRLINFLKSDNDDKDEDGSNFTKDIVMEKDSNKGKMDFAERLDSLEVPDTPYKFPYDNYQIVGCNPSSKKERLWIECVRLIGKEIGCDNLYNYFINACQFLDFNDNAVTVGVPSMWYANEIEKIFLNAVSSAIKCTFGKNATLYYEVGIHENNELFSTEFATLEIDRIINTCDFINIDVADIESTLSKDAVNYVTIGSADGEGCIANALKSAIGKLPIEIGNTSQILFNIWMPKNMQSPMTEMKSMTDFIKNMPSDINICWGCAYDDSLEVQQAKVSLIAASK